MSNSRIYIGDALEKLKEIESESVQCCVTSPPYWGLRDYGCNGQIGLEKTPEEYIARLVAVFEEVKRMLKNDGTLWLNLGDTYAGSGGAGGDYNKGGLKEGQPKWKNRFEISRAKDRKTDRWGGGQRPASGYLKPKDLCMIPARTVIELQRAGWWLRSEIVWHKPNPMPESVDDRPTKSHEMIYLLTKSANYYYDAEAIYEPAAYDGRKDTIFKGGVKYKGFQEQPMLSRGHERWPKSIKNLDPKKHLHGETQTIHRRRAEGFYDKYPARNKRDVWTINTENFDGAHFATFPTEIPRLCIAAGSKKGDIVLDPFCGSGTTGEMALRMERQFVGIELNEKYVRELVEPRLSGVEPLLNNAVAVL